MKGGLIPKVEVKLNWLYLLLIQIVMKNFDFPLDNTHDRCCQVINCTSYNFSHIENALE